MEKKIKPVLLIGGISLVVIFLILIALVNIWVKLSVDQEKNTEMGAPDRKTAAPTKPIPAAALPKLSESEMIEAEQSKLRPEIEREMPIKSGVLIN